MLVSHGWINDDQFLCAVSPHVSPSMYSNFMCMVEYYSLVFQALFYRWSTVVILCISGVVITAAALYLLYGKRRLVFSYVVDRTANYPILKPDNFRKQFNNLVLLSQSKVKTHTHPRSAADRSGASLFIDRLGSTTGYTPYFYQLAKSDIRHNRVGYRDYHWIKDVGVKAAEDRLNNDNLFAMVDVDYYVDIPKMLNDNPMIPHVFYTLQPKSVARSSDDYNYTFNKNNEVVYHVNGGSSYVHPVWDYNFDNLLAVRRIFGIPIQSTAYLIDRRSTDQDHDLVSLTPLARWGLIGTIFSKYLYSNTLGRYSVVHGDFTRMIENVTNVMHVHTSKVDSFVVSKTPMDVDDALSSICRTSKYDLTLPQVLSYNDGDRVGGTVLLEYHRSKAKLFPMQVFPVEAGIKTYQYYTTGFDFEAKPSLVAYMKPILDGCYAPALCEANERKCIEKRIESIKTPDLTLPPFVSTIMDEFIEQLLPIKHALDPVDLDEVQDKQNRPTQRSILNHAFYEAPQRKVKMFLKREAYQNIKDPRPISQINGCDKLEYSTFSYSFAKVLHDTDWYAFGKKPLEIANRVTEICATAKSVQQTDFSRMDGRVSNILRELEQRTMLRAFRRVYHDQLLDALASQHHLKGKSTSGVKYDTDWSRLSGSPETAQFNSLASAFVAFLAQRMTKDSTGRFPTPQEAYKALGLYGGDDGFTADTCEKAYTKAAVFVGQLLEIDTVQRGCRGVNFLARFYGPQVWHGDNTSMCDLPRALSKFHATPCLPPNITPKVKFMEKCTAMSYTDRGTPIFMHLIEAMERIAPKYVYADHLSLWNSQYSDGNQYPNQASVWMGDELDIVFPFFDYPKFMLALKDCKSIEDILDLPSFCPPVDPVSKETAIVNEEVVGPPLANQIPLRGDVRPKGKEVRPCRKGRNCTTKGCRFKHPDRNKSKQGVG
jgi:hypothetical protein